MGLQPSHPQHLVAAQVVLHRKTSCLRSPRTVVTLVLAVNNVSTPSCLTGDPTGVPLVIFPLENFFRPPGGLNLPPSSLEMINRMAYARE